MKYFLNIASIRPCTESEGPGKRFAIWCQGCLNRCPGCCNPEMQPIEKKHIVSVEDLEQLILDTKKSHNIEGVSFIGGEPFLQAKGLAVLAQWCKLQGLSVLIFTGYKIADLESSNIEGSSELLSSCDILVDGLYNEDEPDNERPWVGSKNQKVHNISGFYPVGIEYDSHRAMEVLISKDAVLINGWPFEEAFGYFPPEK